MVRQPNLARTLRAIVDAEKANFATTHDRIRAIHAGRDAFYPGSIARRIADADKAAGGVFTYEDLAGYHGRIENPTTTSFHGFDVYKAGPWNQGPVLLQTLNILEGVDLKSAGANSAEYIHQMHEAIKLAYDDRNAYYGDPPFAAVPMMGLLSKPYAAERRKLIGARAALDHRVGDPFAFDPDVKAPPSRYVPHAQGAKRSTPSGDTTCVDVVDKDGNLFSATPSSGWRIDGGGHRGGGLEPDADLRSRSAEPQRPRRREASAHDADADARAQGRQAVPRDQHARRRQPGPADPQRAAADVRVRQADSGSARGAARQLAASLQLVRQSRERGGRAGDRKPRERGRAQ